VYNHIRRKLVHQLYEKSKQYYQITHTNHTAERIAYKDLSDAVDSAVARLPEKTQAIFKLNHFEHHSPHEISILLQIPKRTIEYHLTQSSRLLRIELKEFI
jgi:RNA polymerase sigma-70 factor (ECF subfamily)